MNVNYVNFDLFTLAKSTMYSMEINIIAIEKTKRKRASERVNVRKSGNKFYMCFFILCFNWPVYNTHCRHAHTHIHTVIKYINNGISYRDQFTRI